MASPISFPARLLAGVAVLSIALAACGSGSPTASPAPAATQAPATQTPASQPPASEAPASTPATGSATVAVAGGILVGPTGMALYTHAGDSATSSTCSGGCLAAWPALTVTAGTTPTAGSGVAGTLATFTRADDGTTQVTYNGLPLYYFASDSTAGTATGDGVGGFAVAKP